MPIQLVVRHQIGHDYQIGDHITDPVLVAKFLASHPDFVVKKALEESPASPPPAASSIAPVAEPASPPSLTVPTLKPIL
jgi:hypothetical protein